VSHLGHRLSALIDGELDGAERDRVLVHLARCEPCRSEAVALRTLKRRMNALGEAAADAALTRRLIGLGQPGGAARAGSSGQAPWSRLGAGSLAAAYGGRELRPAWYVTFGAAAVIMVGVSAAAFLAGGGTDQPGPRVTPAVDTYVMQHDLMTGVAPVTSAARYGPRPATTPGQGSSPPAP
jgi:anti-sigma factor RsiW